MKFIYSVKGKYVKKRIPQNNYRVPKTKRLRKKKFWFYCIHCKEWLKRYREGKVTLENGKFMCTRCLVKHIKKNNTTSQYGNKERGTRCN